MSNERAGSRGTQYHARPSYPYSSLVTHRSLLVTHRSLLIAHRLSLRCCRHRALWGIIVGGSSKEGEACSYSITKDLLMATLGDMLREAREARGLSPDDVERATRILARYVTALEQHHFQ